MNTTHPIAPFVQGFFHDYLAAQKGLSSNTVLAYRDGLKLFIRFGSEHLGKPVDKLIIEDLDQELVVKFLEHLETKRGNSPQTRNARLAALHAFFHYVAYQEPLVMARCQQICAIPSKRTTHKTIEYLEDEEMRDILNSVQQNSSQGARDYALLLFLYNTGARVQEAVDLKIDDLRLETPFQVKLVGKGRKVRVCPIWPETVEALQNYLNHRKPSASGIPHVFLNANDQRITRFGVRYIVRQYAVNAAQACPSLKSKKVSPHTVRHTTAMHLLQSGNDITTVKDWMGHADVNTTHAYVEIDMKMKRRALDACQPPQTKKKRPRWLNPDILEWLDELSNKAAIMCSPGESDSAKIA